MVNSVETLNEKYGNRLKLELKDQYYNMREKVEPAMHVIDYASRAMEEVGVKPHIRPIRGGTMEPVSRLWITLSQHLCGRHEFSRQIRIPSRSSLEKASEVIVKIAELWRIIVLLPKN